MRVSDGFSAEVTRPACKCPLLSREAVPEPHDSFLRPASEPRAARTFSDAIETDQGGEDDSRHMTARRSWLTGKGTRRATVAKGPRAVLHGEMVSQPWRISLESVARERSTPSASRGSPSHVTGGVPFRAMPTATESGASIGHE